jgi:hypothetical protein
VKTLDLRSALLLLGLLTTAGWSCSKSDAATVAEDESAHRRHDNDPCHGRGRCVTVDNYDDFSDGETYADRWVDVSEYLGVGEPEARASRAFGGGQLVRGRARSYEIFRGVDEEL